MQIPNAPPRDAFTVAQITTLIQDAESVRIDRGCELLDMSLNVIEDISADLQGGSVSRAAFANIHGTTDLDISRDLDWQTAILRPYMLVSDSDITARFNLGAYFTSTPKRSLETTPRVHAVQGFDIMQILQDPVGEAYALEQGTLYLAAVEEILTSRGITRFVIDQSSAATALPTPRSWIMEEKLTWLIVVNDLLAAIGYRGIFSDWDGQLRCEPHVSPKLRSPEWYYDTGAKTSMLNPDREMERDFYEIPNRWVAVRSNQTEGTTPIEGNGIYTFVNQNVGETSVDARNGRTITRFLSIDAADQASLQAQAQVSIDADMGLSTKLKVGTHPNPLHWHFDRLLLNDPEIGAFVDIQGTQWTLELDGTSMTHEWTVLD